jgi:hypothetical protein
VAGNGVTPSPALAVESADAAPRVPGTSIQLREERFAEALLRHNGNATAAAREAFGLDGDSAKTTGKRHADRPGVRERLADALEAEGVTARRMAKGLGRVMGDYENARVPRLRAQARPDALKAITLAAKVRGDIVAAPIMPVSPLSEELVQQLVAVLGECRDASMLEELRDGGGAITAAVRVDVPPRGDA